MYNDPFGELCERIMIVFYCLLMLAALSVYYVYTHVKYAVIKLYLTTWKIYTHVYFFLRLKWNHVYWMHIYEHLYLCGLALTDEYVESRRDRLRASIEAKQHCTDSNVQTAIARARAVLQEQEQ